MRVIEFDRITVENFKTYIGKHVLDYRSFSDGLHFVKGKNQKARRLGSNGAGKSTMFSDALAWCLYGKTASGLRGNDVKPWRKAKGATAVTVLIYIGDKPYKVTRSLRPNLLMLNGKDASQDAIERLLGMSYTVFTNTVLLGQGRPLFLDLQPRDMAAMFIDGLDLGRWDARSKAASLRVAELALAHTECEGEITGFTTSLDSLESYIQSEQQRAKEWDAERGTALKALQTRRKEVAKEHEAASKARDKADLALEAAETERRYYERKLPKAEQALLDADKEMQAAQAVIDQIATSMRQYKNELEDLGEGDRCHHCGQSLKGTALAKHRQELRALIDECRVEVKRGVRPSIAQAVKAAEVQVRDLRKMQRQFADKATEARDSLESQTRIFEQSKASLSAIDRQIAEHGDARNPHVETVAGLRKKRSGLQRALDDAKADARRYKLKQERAAYWIKGFKDLRIYLLDEILAELQMTTNAMLADAGLDGWEVTFSMQKETAKGALSFGLSVLIQSPESVGKVKWESWSGGEGQRLRVVASLALKEVLLNRCGVEPVLEILDEPTRGLSPEGINDLLDYLAARAKRLRMPIFLIDHQARESSAFASVVSVARDGDGSRLQVA